MSMTILYEVHGNLYVNLTNKCPCACTFCLRQTRDHMENSDVLWLEREPTVEEAIKAFDHVDMSKYKEVVFCGFGEPMMRLDAMVEVAKFVKKTYGMPTRVNTNGLADLIYGKPVAEKLKGVIDTVSISLNTPNPQRYLELTRSKFGIQSFEAMLAFAKACKEEGCHVVMTTVATTLTKEEEEQCAKICKDLGVAYRIRPWED